MIKYGELSEALLHYTNGDIHDEIPVDYYRRVIKAWLKVNCNGMHWDVAQAASILLYLAVREGALNSTELNTDGLSSMEHAEKLLNQANIKENHDVVRALSTIRVAS